MEKIKLLILTIMCCICGSAWGTVNIVEGAVYSFKSANGSSRLFYKSDNSTSKFGGSSTKDDFTATNFVFEHVAGEADNIFYIYAIDAKQYVKYSSDAVNATIVTAEKAGASKWAVIPDGNYYYLATYETRNAGSGRNVWGFDQDNGGKWSAIRSNTSNTSKWTFIKIGYAPSEVTGKKFFIHINRSNDNYNLWFTLSDSKIGLAAKAISKEFLWEFVDEGNGFVSLCDKDGNKMGYPNANNAAGVIATSNENKKYRIYNSGSATYPYALRIDETVGNNYLSNNGGYANKMGLYNNRTDGGSQFDFVESAITGATTVLNTRGVGYPKVSDKAGSPYKTLKDYIDGFDFDNWTAETYSGLQTAIDNYKASTDVQLPETGKLYTIALTTSDGKKYYIYDNNGNIAISSANTMPASHLAATYLAIEDGNKTIIKSGTGYFGGISNESPWTKNAEAQVYDAAKHQLTFSALKSGSKVTKSTPDGSVYAKNNSSYVFICKEADGAGDRSNIPFFNGTHTSALQITESKEYNAYKVVFANGTNAGAKVIFNDGTSNCEIGQEGESTVPYIPYFITANSITTEEEARAVLTTSPGSEFTSVSVNGNVITVACKSTMATYNVHITPNNLPGVGVLVGDPQQTYTDGSQVEYPGALVWGTNITNTPVEGYEVVRHEIDGTDIYVTYSKPKTILWTTTSAAGECYRIPAIAVGANGKLVAVSDKRWGGDIGGGTKTSLVFRTSTDNGKTWSESADMATGTGSGETCAFSDPAIIADKDNPKKMVAFSCSGTVGFGGSNWINDKNTYLATARFESNDGGETWNTTLLHDYFYNLFTEGSQVKSLFISSGRIMQSRYYKKGDYNRLYIALLTKDSSGSNQNKVIYSDDFGQNWAVLGGPEASPCPGGDEAKVEELPDGRIVLSSRTNNGRFMNIYTYTNTSTGEGSWQSKTSCGSANNGIISTSGGCNGEILVVPAVKKDGSTNCYLALHSLPALTDRNNVTVYYKELLDKSDLKDVAAFASNWDGKYQVSSTTSAYSTMILQQNGEVGLLYEENLHNGGYDETYIPLSIELITNNAYSLGSETNRLGFVKTYLTEMVEDWVEGDFVGAVSSATKTGVQSAISGWTEVSAANLDAVFGVTRNQITDNQYYRLHQMSQDRYAYVSGTNMMSASNKSGGQFASTGVSALFRFEPDGNGHYYVKANDGKYMQVATMSVQLTTGSNKEAYSVYQVNEGLFALRATSASGGYQYIHTNQSSTDNKQMVGWDAGANSQWRLEPVADYDIYELATSGLAEGYTPTITFNAEDYTGATTLSGNSFIGIAKGGATPVQGDFTVTSPGYNLTGYSVAGNVITFTFTSTTVTYNITVSGQGENAPTVMYGGKVIALTKNKDNYEGQKTIDGAFDLSDFQASIIDDMVATATKDGSDINVVYSSLPFKTSNTVAHHYGMKSTDNTWTWYQYHSSGTDEGKMNRINGGNTAFSTDNMLWIYKVAQVGDGSQAVTISPFGAQTLYMSYEAKNANAQGPGLILAKPEGEEGYNRFWKVAANGSGIGFKPYLTTTDNFINCHGGAGACAGFYTNSNDGGSRMLFRQVFSMTIADSGLSTLCLPFKATIPDNTYAYTATAFNLTTGVITLSKSEGSKVAGDEGYIIKGASGATVDFIETADEVSAPATNYLVGVAEDTDMGGKTNCYIMKAGKFTLVSGGILAANKAYLDLSEFGVKLNGVFFEDDATGIGIDNVVRSEELGVRSYNIAGQAVGNGYKGIVIKNGKKYLNK